MNEFQIFYAVWRCLRHTWYKYRRKVMRFWDRLKWCVIGGAGYALGRYLFQSVIGGAGYALGRYLFQLVQTYIGG